MEGARKRSGIARKRGPSYITAGARSGLKKIESDSVKKEATK